METALDNQYANELRHQRMSDNFNSGVRSVHDTNDPNKIRSEIAADEARKRGEGGEPRSFREVMAARHLKERAKKKIEEKITAPAKAGTSWLLKASWLNLIDSFGLTLIYINMHVFLRQVFPDAFCKLGEEWKPKMVGESSATNIGGTAFGIVEIMGLLLLDLVVIFIILGALALISMIITWVTNPLKALEDIWNMGWNTFVPALVNLFKGLL